MSEFARRLIRWQRQHGRHDLPWQGTRDAYRVWLSEIMLQQTQVATVIPYYRRFLERFPDLPALAAADVDEVMPYWSGLGYYARARNLHACAQAVMREHGGQFPRAPDALATLPGIGRSTANSIATFCFDAGAPILDGNVKRLLCRCFGIEGFPGSSAVERQLWQRAHELMPSHDGATYNQAQMDMGATVCTRSRPRCERCPVAGLCVARAEERIRELPAPRPRKALPTRTTSFLIVHDAQGCVLLERRPPAGIWGGLHCLPELATGEEAAAWLRRVLGVRAGAVSPASTCGHSFSHFHLTLQPLRCPVPELTQAREPGLDWLDGPALAGAALPAPIRAILQREGFLQEPP